MKGLILTYLLAYGGALAALFNPLIGLFVYTGFAIAKPQLIFAFAGSASNLSFIVGVAMIIGWAFKGFGSWDFGRARTIVLCMGAYYAWHVVSGAFSPDGALAWSTLIDRAKELVIPFLIGITMLSDREQVRRYAWLLVLSQGYVALEMNQNYYLKGNNLAQDFGFYGSMDNNSFAVSLVTTVGPAVVLSLAEPRWWLKGLGLASAVLTVNTVFLTYSRGGMLAMVVSGLVVLLFLPKRPVHILAFVVLLAMGLRLAGPEVRARFASSFVDETERDASAESRVALWSDCLTLMERNPLLGVGPRRWPFVAPEFGWPLYKQAHSLWMQTGAELGVPGLMFLLLFYGITMGKAVPLRLDRREPWNRTAAQVVLTGLTGFAVAAQFVSLEGLEVPFHIVLVGAATLKLSAAGENVEASVPSTYPAAPVAYQPPNLRAAGP